ncbi:IS5/IS1182 family transposase, partial [Lactobacillus crispatus]
WLKGRFLLLKILKRTKKRSRFLKKEILIVFIHLEASFFPDTLLLFLNLLLIFIVFKKRNYKYA